MTLCEGDEAVLTKLPCYKSVPSLTPLKTSGLGENVFVWVNAGAWFMYVYVVLLLTCSTPAPPHTHTLPFSYFAFTSLPAALAACHYLTEMREKIFGVLYKAINSNTVPLQEAGKEAMRKVCRRLCVTMPSTKNQLPWVNW